MPSDPLPTTTTPYQPKNHKRKSFPLTLLPTRLLHLCRGPIPDQPISRLKLLHHLKAIIDEREARAFATTILRPEAEAGDLVFVRFVELRELDAQFVFGNVGSGRVEDVAGFGSVGMSRGRGTEGGWPYTTICLRPRRALRMNLRVRRVTGCSLSAMMAGATETVQVDGRRVAEGTG